MDESQYMQLAIRLARRGQNRTTPNPVVGAVLVKQGRIIGQGWHRKAGAPHAEVEAIRDAGMRQHSVQGATLYVTLEPCSTFGRTPPCTEAIAVAGIKRVVVGAADPNPRHRGRAARILRHAGIEVQVGVLKAECDALNPAFNHWIVHQTPFVTVKAAMTLDGKIATRNGESKWITGEKARSHAMKLRQSNDAILVGINTVLADNPSLTVRRPRRDTKVVNSMTTRRIVLDSMARTPLNARVVMDGLASLTTIVVGKSAPANRVAALADKVRVLVAPQPASKPVSSFGSIDLAWLMNALGREKVTSLLVEGGGEVNASFLLGGFAQRLAFFYSPKILGGKDARTAVAGIGISELENVIRLRNLKWRQVGEDLLLTASIDPASS